MELTLHAFQIVVFNSLTAQRQFLNFDFAHDSSDRKLFKLKNRTYYR